MCIDRTPPPKNSPPNPLQKVEPGKKVACVVQVADPGLRAQLEGERDILALLGRWVCGLLVG